MSQNPAQSEEIDAALRAMPSREQQPGTSIQDRARPSAIHGIELEGLPAWRILHTTRRTRNRRIACRTHSH